MAGLDRPRYATTSREGAVFVANWQGDLNSADHTDLRKSITSVLH